MLKKINTIYKPLARLRKTKMEREDTYHPYQELGVNITNPATMGNFREKTMLINSMTRRNKATSKITTKSQTNEIYNLKF